MSQFIKIKDTCDDEIIINVCYIKKVYSNAKGHTVIIMDGLTVFAKDSYEQIAKNLTRVHK